MTDWLEELLGQVPEEKQEEESLRWDGWAEVKQEDGALGRKAGPEAGGAAGTGAIKDAGRPAGETDRSLPRDRRPEHGWENRLAQAGRETENAGARMGERAPAAAGGTVTEREAENALPSGMSMTRNGLEWVGALSERENNGETAALYRRVVRAGRRTAAYSGREQTAAAEQQSTGTPSLTVDELDRAVRRDSRRYDGGMELY